MFIPVPNAAELSLQFSQADGEFAENVFGVQRDEAWDGPSLLLVANAMATWWHDGDGSGNSYRGKQAATVEFLKVTARDLTIEGGLRVDSTTIPASVTGGGTGNQIQNGLSLSVTARSGLAGRSQRGRTFLVGLAEGNLSNIGDNLITSTVAVSVVDAFNALIGAIHTADSHSVLSVISRRHDNAPRITGVTTPIIQYGLHDLFLDYQRRRAPGHNRHH